LVRGVYRRAGVAVEDLPRGAYLEGRENPLPSAQVLVWKE
jgi:hypothetical protein